MTCHELLQQTVAALTSVGIESPQAESEIILSELLACRRPELFVRYLDEVSEAIREQAEQITTRRITREPLQYILSRAWFMELELAVSPAVLIPRPETELLVERIRRNAPQNAAMLDIGTGSGAIALAVAYARPDLRITAIDCSPDALQIAERNRREYRLDNVKLLQSDLFEQLTAERQFDIIAANLPYVSEDEYAALQPEVTEYEPKLALTAPDNGLALIAKCVAESPEYLRPGGFIILEIGEKQADAVRKMLETTGAFIAIEAVQDYHNRDRFVTATRK